MFKKFTNGCVHLVNRFLPDPFIFCIVLTIIVFVAAIPATGATPLQVLDLRLILDHIASHNARANSLASP